MTRSGMANRPSEAVRAAIPHCPSLRNTHVSPHVIRHSTAMQLLQAGVDLAVIALWLGHESITTTHQYLAASLELKQQALDRLHAPAVPSRRFRPTDKTLAFLDQL